MVDAHSLLGPHPKKFNILRTVPQDTPIAAQLVGEDPGIMLEAAQILLAHVPVVLLDINSACPVKKVVKKRAGAALLKDPQTLSQIISTLASSLSIPVTVKLRIGYSQVDIPALRDLVKACEASGAAALFVHGRTRDQGYAGDINYQALHAVKSAVTIPVVGSGNIFSGPLAKQMLDQTGCDGVLVARGAFGNPWIFEEIEAYLRDGTLPPERSLRQIHTVLKRHLAYIAQYKTASPAGKIGFMRKVALWYLKGFPHASKLRGQINRITDYEALLVFLDEHLLQEAQE
jgi:nifR3 family TIM-barrel protein